MIARTRSPGGNLLHFGRGRAKLRIPNSDPGLSQPQVSEGEST